MFLSESYKTLKVCVRELQNPITKGFVPNTSILSSSCWHRTSSTLETRHVRGVASKTAHIEVLGVIAQKEEFLIQVRGLYKHLVPTV